MGRVRSLVDHVFRASKIKHAEIILRQCVPIAHQLVQKQIRNMLKFVIFSIFGFANGFNMGLPTDYDDQEMMYKRSPAEMEDFMKLLSVYIFVSVY